MGVFGGGIRVLGSVLDLRCWEVGIYRFRVWRVHLCVEGCAVFFCKDVRAGVGKGGVKLGGGGGENGGGGVGV